MGVNSTTDKIPLDLLKQDPSTGMWNFGSIQMTSGEYAIASEFNELNKKFLDLSDRLTKLEGK